MDEFVLVRKSDGAIVADLLLGKEGIGVSPYEVDTKANSNLAYAINAKLKQETRGAVSFGKYHG